MISSGRRNGFTLIELLAVLVIVGLLLATFVPYAMSIRETSNRTRCERNLRELYEALTTYAEPNGFVYPRVRYEPSMDSAWTAFTGPDETNPFVENSNVRPNDVTASLWLLVREGHAQPRAFVCPSGGGSPDPLLDLLGQPTVVKKRGNFRSAEHLNYGYATPFSTIPDYRLNDTLPARFALVADRGPRESEFKSAGPIRFDAAPRELRQINSPNHRGAGQNVLYADGSVSFESSPYVGVGRTRYHGDGGRLFERADGDDIYSALAAKPLVEVEPKHNNPGVIGVTFGPAYRYDAMLVPGADYPEGYTIVPSVPTATGTADAATTAATAAAPASSAPAEATPPAPEVAPDNEPALAPATTPAEPAATQATRPS